MGLMQESRERISPRVLTIAFRGGAAPKTEFSWLRDISRWCVSRYRCRHRYRETHHREISRSHENSVFGAAPPRKAIVKTRGLIRSRLSCMRPIDPPGVGPYGPAPSM